MNGMARWWTHGFAVVNQGYPSRHKPIENRWLLAIEALAACRKEPPGAHPLRHALAGRYPHYAIPRAVAFRNWGAS